MSDNSLIREAYQQLLDTFKGGNIDSLLFTSFNFSASFFENNILPLTAGCSIEEAGGMQAAQINEVLASTQITIVCDRSTAPEPKSNYRYGQLAVGIKDAFFHPKIILATGTLKNGNPAAELIVGSCNLTLSGWGLNREVVGTCVVGKQQANNLLPLIRWLSKTANEEVDRLKDGEDVIDEEGSVRKNLAAIEAFLVSNCQEQVSKEPEFFLRLPSENHDETYLEVLTSGISLPIDSCRIVSPFWSHRKSLQPLLGNLGSKNIDFVPSTNHEGKYCFPEDMREYLKESSFTNTYQGFKNNDRYTHAKVVSLITKNSTHWLIGSANFTNAAMGNMKRGNVEAMLHYKFESTKQLNHSFIKLDEDEMGWAEDSEAEDDIPQVSPYVTNAAYNWKTGIFSCVLECSDEAFKSIKSATYSHQPLNFIRQDDGSYKAKLKLDVKQPVYTIDISFTDNEGAAVYQGLVAQWNAKDDELIYSPRPKLSKIMDDLRALDPVKGPKGGGGSKGSSTEPGEEEDEEERVFDFFSIYQAFYKQRKYFSKHPGKDPFHIGSAFSLPIMFRAINLEIENRAANTNDLVQEDVIYYYIFLSELASTAKTLATSSTVDISNSLIEKIDLVIAQLADPFKKLMGESKVLKQFLHTDLIDQSAIESILGWFKEQVDYTHG